MAEAELTIKYREPLTKAIFVGASLLFPLAVFIFCWTSLILALNLSHPGMQVGNAYLLAAFNFVLTAGLGLLAFAAGDDVVFTNRDGINLPFFICPGPYLRVRKKWANLASMQFIQSGERGASDEKCLLVMLFEDGSKARLNLKLVKPKVLDKMIMAIDVWTEGVENFSALLDARSHMLEEGWDTGTAAGGALQSREQDMSYTGLWQEELGRRFGATNFIPLEPGEKILDETFTIERQLAFGGLSAIYLATKKDLSRFVLKEAVVPGNDNDQLVAASHDMLSREAKMLASLSHQQIARVYDHFVDRGRHYLVLEYIPGTDLRQLVHNEGRQEEEQVIAWAIDMARMLIYLHERPEPVIHRDFTPDNILLKPDGSIAVIDFGAANFFLGTATGTMIGKQAYIAPEQLRGKASLQSDLYALGGCMFFLSTGVDPEPISASHPRELVPALSSEFDQLVSACTQMEKEDRPKNARAVLDSLQALAAQKARAGKQ